MLYKNLHPFSQHLINHITSCCNKGDLFVEGDDVIDRAINESIAIVCNSRLAKLYSSQYCDMVLLPDANVILPQTVGVAFPRGSPLRFKFNQAIKLLQLDGTIKRLEAKYWKRHCDGPMYACPEKAKMFFN